MTYRDAYLERLALETEIAEMCYENLVFSGPFVGTLLKMKSKSQNWDRESRGCDQALKTSDGWS